MIKLTINYPIITLNYYFYIYEYNLVKIIKIMF